MLGDALAVIRYHIVCVAMAAAVVFGWLFTGDYLWDLAVVVGADWFVINLVNRVTDLDEDLANDIRGTRRVARRPGAVVAICVAVVIASFAWTIQRWPELTGYRVAVQAIGVAYNFRVIWTPRGWTRLKELYLFKNTGSSAIFVLTCFAYPLAVAGGVPSWPAVLVLAGFFVLFELTYEILYDLRDLEGDRAAGIPTFPVVHGPERAVQIIDGLLAASAAVLIGGFFASAIGARELLMIAAPGIQLGFYRWRMRGGLTSADCVWLTHLGTGLLLFYLLGNRVWLELGLPANLTL